MIRNFEVGKSDTPLLLPLPSWNYDDQTICLIHFESAKLPQSKLSRLHETNQYQTHWFHQALFDTCRHFSSLALCWYQCHRRFSITSCSETWVSHTPHASPSPRVHMMIKQSSFFLIWGRKVSTVDDCHGSVKRKPQSESTNTLTQYLSKSSSSRAVPFTDGSTHTAVLSLPLGRNSTTV